MSLHRVREAFKEERTACINRIRGVLVEFGLVFGKSPKTLRCVLPDVLEDAIGVNSNSPPRRPRRAVLLDQAHRGLDHITAFQPYPSEDVRSKMH